MSRNAAPGPANRRCRGEIMDEALLAHEHTKAERLGERTRPMSETGPTAASDERVEAPKTFLQRLLDGVERVGNRVPGSDAPVFSPSASWVISEAAGSRPRSDHRSTRSAAQIAMRLTMCPGAPFVVCACCRRS
jgi:hypothetical protein